MEDKKVLGGGSPVQQIVFKALEEVKPYANNPRKNDDAVEYVANSIREFGFKVPIIIDSSGEIVAGHTRYKAAKLLGMEKIPCIIASDLTDEQIKAYRLADNKVSEKAGWDFELLESELEEIIDFNMSDFGFEEMPDIDMDGFFEQSESKPESKEKEIKCPHCGMYFTA